VSGDNKRTLSEIQLTLILLFAFHGDFRRVQLEKMRTNLNNNFLFSNRKNKNKRRRNKRRRRIDWTGSPPKRGYHHLQGRGTSAFKV
jgi:hypothetical protein